MRYICDYVTYVYFIDEGEDQDEEMKKLIKSLGTYHLIELYVHGQWPNISKRPKQLYTLTSLNMYTRIGKHNNLQLRTLKM